MLQVSGSICRLRSAVLSVPCLGLLVALLLAPALASQERNVFETDTHRFTEVRNQIYLAQSTARVFNSSSLVVVNDDDVVVVDSHVTPSKARDLIASIKELTDKPISALINSHHHWDHAHGNQEFDDLPIIGHEYAYKRLSGDVRADPTFVRGLEGNQATIERILQQIAEAEDGEGKTALQAYLEMFRAHAADFDEIEPEPPNVTLKERMTLHRPGRGEIQILFLGRAHTGGDLMVYFPQDKLVFTGDVAFGGPSFLGDGYVGEWPQTLENLKALDFDIFVPGHGPPVTDLRRIDLVQEYYRDLWRLAAEKHAAGVSAEDAAKTIDLTHHTEIPINNVGVDLISIQRIYHLLDNPQ